MDNDYSECSSDDIERQLQEQFNTDRPVTQLRYPLTATSLVIPALPKTESYYLRPERVIKMTDTQNPYKAVIYQAMVAAYNWAFNDEAATEGSKWQYSDHVPKFIAWLNEETIENPYTVLKEYESFRFDELDNHGGLSAIGFIKTILTYACDDSVELQVNLSSVDLLYLAQLRRTKVSPNLNRRQESLASYFGTLDWLRQEDMGIGQALYAMLASPKRTVASLALMASALLLEINQQKQRFKQFVVDHEIDIAPFEPECFNKLSSKKRVRLVGEFVYSCISAIHLNGDDGDKAMMTMVLLSIACSKDGFGKMQAALDSQPACDAVFLNPGGQYAGDVSTTRCEALVSMSDQGWLFSPSLLFQLVLNDVQPVVTVIESVLFTWLMACQTVQPSDIPKLTQQDFQKLQVGERITHIECKYFKGRARVVHTTRALSTKTVEGKAILSYLTQHGEGPLTTYTNIIAISKGVNSLTGCLTQLLQLDSVKNAVGEAHKNRGDLPLVMPSVLLKLIENGKAMHVLRMGDNCTKTENPYIDRMFRLRAIKNSAVHAFSDPYTRHYLINYNSHSNQTEKQHYLNADNEQWINSCGRITREVMHDLIHNVFDLKLEELSPDEQQQKKKDVNEEFTAVTDAIMYTAEEMLARLRVVTGQEKGMVNEVGVLKHCTLDDNSGLAPLYVLDSPVTAWRFYNYLHEFKTHYRQLLAVNPDHFFKTVLPTVEWMEWTLIQLSKESRTQGKAYHQKMLEDGVTVSVFHSI